MSLMEETLAWLDRLGVSYTLERHPAAYTVAQLEAMPVAHPQWICKNLFLRNGRGDRQYLAVLPGARRADLKALGEQLGAGKLSFASERRLMDCLGLTKGSVTPLGILQDREKQVVVALERSLMEQPLVGVHPNDNTATVWMQPRELVRVVESRGNLLVYVTLPHEKGAGGEEEKCG